MMDTLTFSLVYIAIAYLAVGVMWLVTTPPHTLLVLGLPPTRTLQIALNMLHIISGVFFPLMVPFDIPVRSFGLTLLTIGAILAIWAKHTMKEHWGLPGQHEADRQQTLIVGGAFQHSRNPIYVGIILMSLGTAIALKSIFIFLILVLYLHLLMYIRQEERLLKRQFGKEYTNYSKVVPRFI